MLFFHLLSNGPSRGQPCRWMKTISKLFGFRSWKNRNGPGNLCICEPALRDQKDVFWMWLISTFPILKLCHIVQNISSQILSQNKIEVMHTTKTFEFQSSLGHKIFPNRTWSILNDSTTEALKLLEAEPGSIVASAIRPTISSAVPHLLPINSREI